MAAFFRLASPTFQKRVLTPTFGTLPNVVPLLAAKMAGIPVRISYNLSTSHPGESKTIVKDLLRPFGNLFVSSRAANSNLAWDWLFGKNSHHERTIIPNAISLKTYHYDEKLRTRVRSKLGWDKCFVIGHIGRYEYQKNHLFLIEVFQEILAREPRARLALVGQGSLKPDIFSKIKELGIGDYVVDLGATEDLNGLYNAFDCFVLPSYYEGLPVVGIEAQATGCPCLFSSEISQEVRVLDAAGFLSLSESASKWADTVLHISSCTRMDGGFCITEHGFEAKDAARKLEFYYKERLAEQNKQLK